MSMLLVDIFRRVLIGDIEDEENSIRVSLDDTEAVAREATMEAERNSYKSLLLSELVMIRKHLELLTEADFKGDDI
jgi:hypothetical protein